MLLGVITSVKVSCKVLGAPQPWLALTSGAQHLPWVALSGNRLQYNVCMFGRRVCYEL